MGWHAFLQGIFPGIFQTQRSNLELLHCRQILYHLTHQGNQRNAYLLIYLFIQPMFIVLSLCPTKSWDLFGFFFFFFFLVSARITSKVLEKRGHHALLTWNPKEWLRLTSTRESNHFQDHFFELKLNTIATLLPISKYVHLCNIVFRVSSVKSNDNILIAQWWQHKEC